RDRAARGSLRHHRRAGKIRQPFRPIRQPARGARARRAAARLPASGDRTRDEYDRSQVPGRWFIPARGLAQGRDRTPARASAERRMSRMEERSPSPLLLIVSSPSGAGKTTLTNLLRQRVEGVAFSVSHTTRKPRANEKDGREYHFVTPEVFRRMIAE